MRHILIAIIFFYTNCSIHKDIRIIKWSVYIEGNKKYLFLKIPNHFNNKTFKAPGFETGAESRYWYGDSAVLYITDNKYGSDLNYHNLENQPGALSKLIINDTLILQGVDKAGKFWKQIRLNSTCFGYCGIPQEKKEQFDKAVNSWKLK